MGNTFSTFQDHFTGEALDAAKWDEDLGTPTITFPDTTTIQISKVDPGGSAHGITTDNTFAQGFSVEMLGKPVASTDHALRCCWVVDANNRGELYHSSFGDPDKWKANTKNGGSWGSETDVYTENVGSQRIIYLRVYSNTVKANVLDTDRTVLGTEFSRGVGSWGVAEVELSVYASVAGTQTMQADWIFLRDFVSPEPAHSTWYTEEDFTPTALLHQQQLSPLFPVSPIHGFLVDTLKLHYLCQGNYYCLCENIYD